MTVQVTNKDFSFSVKYLKKHGYTFDPSTKTWTGKNDSWLIEKGYVTAVSVREVNDLASDMDKSESIN